MLKKLRIKFVCINMTIITVMLVCILCMVIQFTKINLEQANMQMMDKIATNPLYLMKPTDDFGVRIPYFSLRLDENGKLQDFIGMYYDLSDQEFINELIKLSYSEPENTGLLTEYNLRYMRLSTPTDQFLVFVDISNEISTINTLTRNCIFIGIFSFFIFLGVCIFFANWAVKPVEKAWSQQKQFIADASHELKTPLTVILTNAELLQSNEISSENHFRFSENILLMAKQMRNLVEGLLDLSRVDNGSMKAVMKPLNFSNLVETSVYLFEPLYFEHDLQLVSDIDSDIQIKGSESHLKQVINILLDNAQKYATPHTSILLSLKKQHFFCELSVSNYGEAISPEDLTNIFKRFYRADKSRSASGSYGLGLSIAESIVTEHHGKIWAESEDGVNTFYVRLAMQG